MYSYRRCCGVLHEAPSCRKLVTLMPSNETGTPRRKSAVRERQTSKSAFGNISTCGASRNFREVRRAIDTRINVVHTSSKRLRSKENLDELPFDQYGHDLMVLCVAPIEGQKHARNGNGRARKSFALLPWHTKRMFVL